MAYSYKAISFIPISGYVGDNLTWPSDNMPWYDGPTLLRALENLRPAKRLESKPLRIPIRDVYKIGGIGTVPVGRVETGILKPGMRIRIAPFNITTEVKGIEIHQTSCSEATPGDVIGFNVKNLSVRDLSRGHVASDPSNDPAECVRTFIAHIIIMNYPTQIYNGYTPVVNFHVHHVACRFNILAKVSQKGELIED